MTHTSYRLKRYTTRLAITWTVENLNRISRYTTVAACTQLSSLGRPQCIVAIAGRRAPHLVRQLQLFWASCAATRIHWDDLYRQNRVRIHSSGDPKRRSPVYGSAYSGARIVWGDAAVAVRAGVAELATFVCSSSSDMTRSDYASVVALRCQVS